MDVAANGDAAFGHYYPEYLDGPRYPAYVTIYSASNINPGGRKIEAPHMREMRALAMTSADDIWFVGRPDFDPYSYYIFNYQGGEWSWYEDPGRYGMDLLYFFSPGEGLGFDGTDMYRLTPDGWRYWTSVPDVVSLKPCDFKSPTEIWAVGYPRVNDSRGSRVLRFDGTSWREVFRPGYHYAIHDVAMWDGDNGWAVGYYRKGKDYGGRLWRCREGTWHECACPVRYALGNIEFVSPVEAWALTYNKILHYTTKPNIAPASLGRVKALYAAGRGSDSKGPLTDAYLVPAAPGPTNASGTPTSGSHSPECSTDDAE